MVSEKTGDLEQPDAFIRSMHPTRGREWRQRQISRWRGTCPEDMHMPGHPYCVSGLQGCGDALKHWLDRVAVLKLGAQQVITVQRMIPQWRERGPGCRALVVAFERKATIPGS